MHYVFDSTPPAATSAPTWEGPVREGITGGFTIPAVRDAEFNGFLGADGADRVAGVEGVEGVCDDIVVGPGGRT